MKGGNYNMADEEEEKEEPEEELDPEKVVED